MVPLFLGILVGASLLLLGREWLQLAEERRDPGGELGYDLATFRRRALVSLLLLAIAALITNQPFFFEVVEAPVLRLAYLSAYLVAIGAIYLLLWVDFIQGRRLAGRLREELLRTQEEYARELERLYAAAPVAAPPDPVSAPPSASAERPREG